MGLIESSCNKTRASWIKREVLKFLILKFKPDYVVACYDLPQPTYRHEAYEAYKAGRKKTDDALVEQLKSSRNIFKAFNIPMYDHPGFEADDMLGTIVHQVLENKDLSYMDVVIASGDMDTLQLVSGDRVRVFTLKKGIKDTVIYNEEAVVEEKHKTGFFEGLRLLATKPYLLGIFTIVSFYEIINQDELASFEKSIKIKETIF
mgnify:CR=1 FL=1